MLLGSGRTVESVGDQAAQVRIRRSSSGTAEFQLVNGEAYVREGTNELPLEVGKRVLLDLEPNRSETRIFDEIVLQEPEDRVIHPFGEILLQGRSAGLTKLEVLVATARGIETLETTKNRELFYAIFRPPETDKRQLFTWWARESRTNDQAQNESDRRRFYVNPPQVRILFPQNGDQIVPAAAQLTLKSEVNLGQPLTKAALHLTSEVHPPQVIPIGSQSQLNLNHLKPGPYSARVEVHTPTGFKFQSEMVAFRVLDDPRQAELEVEQDLATLSPELMRRGLKVLASIRGPAEINGFEFELTSPVSASGPLILKSKGSIFIKPTVAGEYMIRGRALPQDGSAPWSWSQPHQIKIVDTPVSISYRPQPASFVRTKPGTSEVFVIEGVLTGGYSSRLQLQVLGAKASEISSDSRSFRALVDQSTELRLVSSGPAKLLEKKIMVQVFDPPPQPISPEDKSQLVFLRSKQSSLILQWVDPLDSSQFEVELVHVSRGLTKTYRIGKPSLTLKTAAGPYRWRVRRFSERPQAWSPWFSVELTQK